MIDYLEALLEEQEREEAEQLGIVLPAEEERFLRRTRNREEQVRRTEGAGALWTSSEETDALAGRMGSEEGGRGAAGVGTQLPAGTGLVRGAEGDWLPRARPAAPETRPWSAVGTPETEPGGPPAKGESPGEAWTEGGSPPEWLEEAGRAGERRTGGGAAWLYQRLRAAAAAAGSAGRAGETVTLVKETGAAGAPLSAAEVDRALERDARRYDGGFTLF